MRRKQKKKAHKPLIGSIHYLPMLATDLLLTINSFIQLCMKQNKYCSRPFTISSCSEVTKIPMQFVTEILLQVYTSIPVGWSLVNVAAQTLKQFGCLKQCNYSQAQLNINQFPKCLFRFLGVFEDYANQLQQASPRGECSVVILLE